MELGIELFADALAGGDPVNLSPIGIINHKLRRARTWRGRMTPDLLYLKLTAFQSMRRRLAALDHKSVKTLKHAKFTSKIHKQRTDETKHD